MPGMRKLIDQRELFECITLFYQSGGIACLDVMYKLFDDKGNTLTRKEPLENGEFSLEQYPSGTYYVWIYANNTYISKKIVKI